MKRTTFLFLFILGSVPLFFSQTEEVLKKQLATAKDDSAKVRILSFLASWGGSNNDSTYAVKLKAFANEKLKDRTLGDSTKNRLARAMITAIDNIAFIKQQSGDGLTAIKMWEEALKWNESLKDETILGTTLLNIGYVHDHKGNIPVALDYYHKALTHLEHTQDPGGLGAVFNNLASLYNRQGNSDKALEYYQKGLDIQKNEINMSTAVILDNLAGIYVAKKEIEKAQGLWKRSLEIHTALNNKTGIAGIYFGFSNVERQKGNYSLSLEYIEKALKLNQEMNNKMGIERAYSQMGHNYFAQKDYKKAKEYTEKAFNMAKEFKYPTELMNISLGLAQIYAGMEDYKQAYKMEIYYKQMSDSVNKENTKRLAMKKTFEYTFQKQVAQDSLKAAEAEKLFSAEIKQQKTQSMALYVGLGLVAVFSIFMYNRFRITQKQKAIIEHQKHLVDEKQKEIIQSIQYAKRIQQALMPSEKLIQKNLDELM